ncbi:MAG TPA: energy transducer TonB, partial [Longimicrobiaceae bacterium]|nr:energy transducer TonB [Longimicrobiaceae bacterium]
VRGRSVTLLVTVDASGKVRRVEVETSTGDRGFDAKLRRTAMEWRFHPARNADGKAVEATVPISFSF